MKEERTKYRKISKQTKFEFLSRVLGGDCSIHQVNWYWARLLRRWAFTTPRPRLFSSSIDTPIEATENSKSSVLPFPVLLGQPALRIFPPRNLSQIGFNLYVTLASENGNRESKENPTLSLLLIAGTTNSSIKKHLFFLDKKRNKSVCTAWSSQRTDLDLPFSLRNRETVSQTLPLSMFDDNDLYESSMKAIFT